MTASRVVVFGAGEFSSLAWYCLTHDSEHEVVGFTVDGAYLDAPRHQGLPLVAFEDLAAVFPPEEVRLLIPIGYTAINGLRRARYEAAKARGYRFISYISSRASVWPDLQVGENCVIYDHAMVQPFASIGNNVIVRSGAMISHHCHVADHAFVAAGVTLGGGVRIGEQAFIGIGASLKQGLDIAARSFVGAGAVLISDTEVDGVYMGNPAKKLRQSAAQVG